MDDPPPSAEPKEHPLRTPVQFYYNAGRKWNLHSTGDAATVVEAIFVWLCNHNPETLALESTLYASIGGPPKWEAHPDGALLEFNVPASRPQTDVWGAMLVALANNQLSHVCATDCPCGYTQAPLIDADAVFALALCVRTGRIRVEIWLRGSSAAVAESVAKRVREMLLDVKFVPKFIAFSSFRSLQENGKVAAVRF